MPMLHAGILCLIMYSSTSCLISSFLPFFPSYPLLKARCSGEPTKSIGKDRVVGGDGEKKKLAIWDAILMAKMKIKE
jgi:hypothetical protein